MNTVAETETAGKADSGLAGLIGRLAAVMRNGAVGPGEMAQLRRLDTSSPDQPAFWRIASTWIAPDRELSADEERRWAIVVGGMARMAPNSHIRGRPVGRVLAELSVAEGRMTTLLRARGDAIAPAVRRVAVMLSARGEAVDWTGLAALILTTDKDRGEELRLRIAKDYYSTLAKQKRRAAK